MDYHIHINKILEFKKIKLLKLFIKMIKEKDRLKKIYQKLNEEENIVFQKWHESIGTKIIVLLPLLAFFITFLKVNTNNSIIDLLVFLSLGVVLVAAGVLLNFLLTKGK